MNVQFPFDLDKITLSLFRRWVWLLSGSRLSFYCFEKKYDGVLSKMFSEGVSDSVDDVTCHR